MGSSESKYPEPENESPSITTVEVTKNAHGVTFYCEYPDPIGAECYTHDVIVRTREAIIGTAMVGRGATSLISDYEERMECCTCWSFLSRLVAWLRGEENDMSDKEPLSEEGGEEPEVREFFTHRMTSLTATARLGDFITLFSPSWSAEDVHLAVGDNCPQFRYPDGCFVIRNEEITSEEECEEIWRGPESTELEIIRMFAYTGHDNEITWTNAKESNVQKAIEALKALPDTTVVVKLPEADENEKEGEEEGEDVSDVEENEHAKDISDDSN